MIPLRSRAPTAPREAADIAEVLMACHHRIRHFIRLAHKLAVLPAPESEIAETAAAIERYFTVALPLHAEDEDLSLLPRLRSAGDLRVVLLAESLAAQHEDIHITVHRAAPLWREIPARAPHQRDAASGPLLAAGHRLATLFESHLPPEERHILPAANALPEADRVAILAEMQARREAPVSRLRREPFHLFFPLAIALGAAGVLPWLLLGRGISHTWPGTYHALTMTQSFLCALAVGFLGTMIPRRMNAAPMSWLELGLLALGLVAIPIALHRGAVITGELCYLGVLATLAQFVLRRAVRAGAGAGARRPPPSFVLIPAGVLLGVAGAVLLIIFLRWRTPPWTFELGRQLTQQGLLLGLVLALAPLLAPLISTGDPPAEPTPGARRLALAGHAAAAALLLFSFVLEARGYLRSGLGLRGAVCLVELLAGGLLGALTRPGLHRWLFRAALFLIPIGLLAAGAAPLRRVPLLHVSFISGLFLLSFAVSVHVTLLHTDNQRLADTWPWPVALIGLLTVAAAAVRVSADAFPRRYFESLTLAAELWLAAALVWAAYLVPKLIRRRLP